MTILITGISGFAGGHCARLFLSRGYRVVGLVTPVESGIVERGTESYCADLRSAGALRRVMRLVRPDRVLHLAAQSSVPESRRDPRATFETNVIGTINLLDAVRKESSRAKVVLVSSGDVYGKVSPAVMPISEEVPVNPANFYSASKVSMELVGRLYNETHGSTVLILRPFNHIGPGQRPAFVCSSFAMQIARMEKGLQEPVMRVGNLDAERDFTDVRDMARAYLCAITELDEYGCYNISSGHTYQIREILGILKGMSKKEFSVITEKSRLRKREVDMFAGSSEQFRSRTDWKPEIDIETTLEDILEYWRERVT